MATSIPASTSTAPAAQASTPAKSAKPASAPKAAPTVAGKAVKVALKPAAKPIKAATPVAAKDAKVKKPKLVRDSFTIPKDEYAVIETLKQRASTLAHPVKKSELLRAGLKVLANLSDNGLRTALQAVPSIKTGRPKAEAAEAPKATNAKAPAKSAHK